jgi:CHASE2 domain-containing sensor protein
MRSRPVRAGAAWDAGWLPDWLPASLRPRPAGGRLTPARLRIVALVAVAVVSGAVAIVAWSTGALNTPEYESIDARFSIRGSDGPDPRIALVGIDAETLAQLNVTAPIPRIDIARLLDRLRADGARLIVLDLEINGRSAVPSQDAALLAAIARDRPVLMGAVDPGAGRSRPVGATSAPGAVLARLGVDANNDGVTRQMLYAQDGIPTLAVTAAALLTGHPISAARFPDNHAWIDFRGAPGTFAVQSLSRVISGAVPASALRGKVVIVGETDPILKDVFDTAASSDPMAGAELQANALSTILGGFPLQPAGGIVDVLLILILAAVPAMLSLRLASLYAFGGSLLAVVVLLIVVQLAFNAGTILPLIAPLLGLVLAVGGSIGAESLVERRRRQALENALRGLIRPAGTSFFISYRRDQAAFAANSLRKELAARFGESSVFKDTHAIHAGTEWPREIQEAILGASVMLVLIGPYWLDARSADGRRRLDYPGDWVRLEIAAGLRRPELVVVPVLLDGAAPPFADALPAELRPITTRNAISLSGERLGEEVDQLVSSIESGQIRRFLRPRPTTPVLCVLGPGGPRRFPVAGELVLGSAAGADVRIADDRVAGRHAKVWPVSEGMAIEDLGSPGGTWVNGARVDGVVRVQRPAALRLGGATVVIELVRPAPAGRDDAAPGASESPTPAEQHA